MTRALLVLSIALLVFPLVTNAVQSFLTLYVNVMNYGTVLMLQNSSGVLTAYELPSSFNSVPNYNGVQSSSTGNPIQQVINVSLQNGEVALINEYGATGFSTQNFIYQQISPPNIQVNSGSTTIWGGAGGSSGTVTVKANEGYQVNIVPWQGIQDWPVNTVESTSWKVLPYWQDGELVINTTDTSNVRQFVAWKYTPVSNVINITLHVTSYPVNSEGMAIYIFSSNLQPNPAEAYASTSWYTLALYIAQGNIYFKPVGTTSSEQLASNLPIPHAPFTFTVILTENSAGNITVSTYYINGTAYTVNVNVPAQWNQIGYIGLGSYQNDVYYVSYFSVSPSPYGGVEAFVDSVESTSWKVLPYWQDGELLLNESGASEPGQYVAWAYRPLSNVINITVNVKFLSVGGGDGILLFSPNVGDQPGTFISSQSYYDLLITFNRNGNQSNQIVFGSPSTSNSIIYNDLPPTNPSYPFTFTVILTENASGYVTVQSVYINGTKYVVNVNTPFPWSQIGYVGLRVDYSDVGKSVYYVSYFSISPFMYTNVQYTINGYSLPSMPDTSHVSAIIAKTTNGSYVLLGYYNGSWHEVNAPLSNPNGQISISYGFAGPVNVTVYSSNVVSYGALFQPGNGVMLEVQNAIPPSSPTNWAPLAYVGTNGEVGGSIDWSNPPFVPVTSNALNYYEGMTTAYTGWVTSNFTNFNAVPYLNLNGPMQYAVVGTGYTNGWANAPGGYYSFSNGYISMVYILNNSVPTPNSPPDVQDLLFFFDPTYVNQYGQFVNPFTNKTYQTVGNIQRFVNNINVYVFADPNVTGAEVFVPPFTELIVRNGTTSMTFVNYDTFPYIAYKLAPGKYQFDIVLIFTAYSFVLINWQGWNVTVYLNGAPMIQNDPITNKIQPFDTEGLLSAQVVADPNTKRVYIYLEPMSNGVGKYVSKFIQFPQAEPNLVLPLSQSTPFSLSTLTTSGLATVGLVIGIVVALARANQDLLGSIAAGGSVVSLVGIIIHLLPVIFLGAVLLIVATAYRFARRSSQQ